MLTFVLLSCSRTMYRTVYPELNDGKYDTEFPYRNCSKELEDISQAVHRVIYTAYYKSFSFPSAIKLKREQFNRDALRKAEEVTFYSQSLSGTATTIFWGLQKIALLASAHNINRPDTLISYYYSHNAKTEYIQSIAIKEREKIYIPALPEDGIVNILVQDKKLDIAILHKELSEPPASKVAVIQYPFGKAKELQWGSYVYLMGFPKSFKMVTRGIVSKPERDFNNMFLLDALFNRGLSGGIVLAIKDGVPNFEIVGIGVSTLSDDDFILVPDKDEEYVENTPYQGDIYVERKSTINYGICKAVAAEAILDMINGNKEYLAQEGYDFSGLFDGNGTNE